MKTPHDGRFKILAEEHPDLLLRLFGVVEPGARTEPIDILRELHLDPVQVDHVYRIGQERLVHFEAITSWRADRVPRLALYRFLLDAKYGRLPISSYLVLMAEKYAPRTLPDRIVYAGDEGLRIEAPYKVIRLWELDAAIAFEPGCEPLLPWAPLLKGGRLREAIRAIVKLSTRGGDPEYPIDVMLSNLAGLAVLRYDRDEIAGLLAGLREGFMLPIDIFEDTWLYKEGQEKGKTEGKAEGRAEGMLEGKAEGQAEGLLAGKREAIRLAAVSRFPSTGELSGLDEINDSGKLDELLLTVLRANSGEEIQVAVQTARSR